MSIFSAHRRALWTALSQEEGEGKERTPQNECFWNNSDPADPIWTESGMDILLDTRNKPVDEFFNPRWPPAIKGPKLAKFDPANHISARHPDPALPIWTKCGIDILLDPRNKPAKQFFIYRQIQDGHRPVKVQIGQIWPPNHVRPGIRIRLIQFGQYVA